MQYKKIILLLFVFSSFCSFAQESLIGTFYGGWARNKGDYIWIKDLGKDAPFFAVGDVNGDGYDDAITANLGKVEVALSETYIDLAGKEVRHFGKKATWADRFGVGRGNSVNSGQYMVGDLNGDSRSDIATFNDKIGKWQFAVSGNGAFETINITIEDFGAVGDQTHFSDVNGDRLADAVIFDLGNWRVRINNGNGFDTEKSYIKSFGSTLSQTFLADVNGDGKADAVYYQEGEVFVAVSDGLKFTSPNLWLTGIKATKVIIGDATGDNRDDLILFHQKDSKGRNLGNWEIGESNGKDSFSKPELWCREHGGGDNRNRITKSTPKAHEFLVGYVQAHKESGNGVSSIAVNKNHGYWQIMPPKSLLNGVTSAKWYNSWHTWNRASLPRIGDQYYGFDADEDTFAIAEIIKELAAVEIDYVLLDQTNAWGVLVKSYRVFAKEIYKWNKVPGNRKVRYAICGKGWKPRGPEDVEESAKRSMEEFVNHPVYGSSENYQYVDGKPLLVIYGDGVRKDMLWETYAGEKTFANRFTIKWMDGHLYPEGMDADNKGDWYGWALVNGSYENAEQMVVQAGFFNHVSFASRFEQGIEGDRYRKLSWDKVLLNKPDKVTIISLVGDHEQNDIYDMRIGDYPEEMGRTEHWSYPEMYWEMTRDYIKNYRMLKKGEIQHIAEYGSVQINEMNIEIPFTSTFSAVPVIYACIQGDVGKKTKSIEVASVSDKSFVVKLSGDYKGSDKINWLAVLPGTWETPNGMKLTSGIKSSESDIHSQFDNAPAIFQLNNAKKQSFIAIETGIEKMWSGRFCSAQQLDEQQEINVEYQLPRYFYDKTITLADASNKSLHPLVLKTTNTGGNIKYQTKKNNKAHTLNICCFDGSGGCLYGSSFDKNE